jgi:hypothetical protein
MRAYLLSTLMLVGAIICTAWSTTFAAESERKTSPVAIELPRHEGLVAPAPAEPPKLRLRAPTKEWGGSIPETAVGARRTEGYTCCFGAFAVGPEAKKAMLILGRNPVGALFQQGPLTFYDDGPDGTVYSMRFDDGTVHYFFLGNKDQGESNGYMRRWVAHFEGNTPIYRMAYYARTVPAP